MVLWHARTDVEQVMDRKHVFSVQLMFGSNRDKGTGGWKREGAARNY